MDKLKYLKELNTDIKKHREWLRTAPDWNKPNMQFALNKVLEERDNTILEILEILDEEVTND